MIIQDIKTTVLSLPHLPGFQDATIRHISQGRSQCFVHVHSDQGLVGLGLGGGVTAAREVIERTLKPILIGQNALHIEKLWDDMFWRIRGVGRKGLAFCALSAVDIALWDLKAKYYQTPLYKLLGPYTDTVPVYGSGGWTHFSVDELIAEQASYVERGMKSVKMKVGKDFGQSEGEDVARLSAVRKALGDDIEILIDANNGYYAKQAIRMAQTFEEYNIGWFEEPVPVESYHALKQVRQNVSVPICVGERLQTRYEFVPVLENELADYIMPDVTWAGGIAELKKIATQAEAYYVPISPHEASGPINVLAGAHTMMTVPNFYKLETSRAKLNAYDVLIDHPLDVRDGCLHLSNRPGLGIEMNVDYLRSKAIAPSSG